MLTVVIMLATSATLLGYAWVRRGVRARHQLPGAIAHSPISALAGGGYSRVRGQVVALKEVLTAPLTGRQCVSYVVFVVVEETEPQHVLARRQAGVPFGIDDGTGKALVEMDGTKILLTVDRVEYVTRYTPTSPRGGAFLAEEGVSFGDSADAINLTISEAILEVGATIEVSGSTTREVDPTSQTEAGYRDSVSTRLHFRKKD